MLGGAPSGTPLYTQFHHVYKLASLHCKNLKVFVLKSRNPYVKFVPGIFANWSHDARVRIEGVNVTLVRDAATDQEN